MAKRGPVRGRCQLCLRNSVLTFEHFPPRAAGNSVPVVTSSMSRFLADPDAFRSSNIRGPKSQRGAGDYLLCSGCNSWLGSKLVPAYLTMSNLLLGAMQSPEGRLVTAMADSVPAPSFANIRLRGPQHPGLFARYALAACMLGAPSGKPMKWHEQAKELVTNLEAQEVPLGFPSLVVNLNAGPLGRVAYPGVSLMAETVWHVEAIGLPWRFGLATGPLGEGLLDITHLLARPGNHRFFDVELPHSIFGFFHMPLPGDRRSGAALALWRGRSSPAHPLFLGFDGESAIEVMIEATDPKGSHALRLEVTVPGLWAQIESHREKAAIGTGPGDSPFRM